jgi:hypothetical protein
MDFFITVYYICRLRNTYTVNQRTAVIASISEVDIMGIKNVEYFRHTRHLCNPYQAEV